MVAPRDRPTDHRPTDRGATMGDRPTDLATDHRPTDHGPVSLEVAADRLGVTVNAVRQRIKRGTLDGHKTPAGWVVAWPPTKATDRTTDHDGPIDAAWSVTDRPTSDQRPTDQPTDRPPAPVSGAARSQLAAIWDEWLAPLTARNEELARETGRLGAELAAAAGERDRLRAERDSDRALADRLVDLLQAERDAARARVAELEAGTEGLAGAAAGPNGHGGGLKAMWSRIRERRR